MIFKAKVFKFFTFLVFVFSLILLSKFILDRYTGEKLSLSHKPVVAITQIAPHPSLDQIRKGILDSLKNQGINAEIIYENAQGNMATATQIAQKFVSLRPNVIIPITTPSTQTVYKLALGNHIPVVFAAVSDPVSAKLTEAIGRPGKGITGISDMSPVKEQIDLIQKLLPSLKKIGVIYNPGEANSLALIEEFEKQLPASIELIKAPSNTTADVSVAAKHLLSKGVNAIYIPNDNTVISAVNSVIQLTTDQKIPIFPADPESVRSGCLATVAHSQYELGVETGKIAARIIKGEDVNTLPVSRPEKVETIINMDVAKVLGISIPKEVADSAREVVGSTPQTME
jgi:putative ABC transport system substrate-binding protein